MHECIFIRTSVAIPSSLVQNERMYFNILFVHCGFVISQNHPAFRGTREFVTALPG